MHKESVIAKTRIDALCMTRTLQLQKLSVSTAQRNPTLDGIMPGSDLPRFDTHARLLGVAERRNESKKQKQRKKAGFHDAP
jgi:hypothetical protein